MNRGSYIARAQEAADRAKDARIEEYFDRYPVRIEAVVFGLNGGSQCVIVDVAADASVDQITAAIRLKADLTPISSIKVTRRF